MIIIELKKVEEGIIPIYENDTKEKLINARELHKKLNNKRQFADWIKQRIKVYFKPKAVKEIQKWFNENKKEIYYEIQYVRNTKNGNKKGEIKERGYKIENVCYKVDYFSK